MSMNVGGGGGVKASINITPLVDVVLVLLIIFMVIQPMLQVGYTVETPPEVKSCLAQTMLAERRDCHARGGLAMTTAA